MVPAAGAAGAAAHAAHSAPAAAEEGLKDLVGVDVLREGVTAAVALEVFQVVAVVVPRREGGFSFQYCDITCLILQFRIIS